MAIYMVVMGHVLTFCVRDIDHSLVFKVVAQLHMPLFFFISGWFTYRLTPQGLWRLPDLKRRARQLLVPMVVMSTLWIYYFPLSGLETPFDSTLGGLWQAQFKNGYWFTLVLFEIILIYSALAPVMSVVKGTVYRIVVVCAAWAVLLLLNEFVPAEINGYLSLELVATYFPIFMVGAIAASARDGFDRIARSQAWVTTSMLVGALLFLYVGWYWLFSKWTGDNPLLMMTATSLLHLSLVVWVIALVKPWCDKECAGDMPSRKVRIWITLGRNSLAIYLLHYFFLFPLGIAREWLVSMACGWTPCFVFAAVIAACVIAMSLGANSVIGASDFLSAIMTGRTRSKS